MPLPCTPHYLVNDDALRRTIPFDLNEPLVFCRHGRRIEPSCASLIHRNPSTVETKRSPFSLTSNWSDAMPPSRSNTHTPHERVTDGKAQHKATSILSSEHFSCIPPKIKPCL
ncbi:hypothetical protein GE09DRAFT_173443 [Coniochaeta sp. 2T2.1]|nr:hypothetical protein GE09DRAFT_173443 [Coniochaeta sp. 2T2.1]